jgi:hypothetical protein
MFNRRVENDHLNDDSYAMFETRGCQSFLFNRKVKNDNVNDNYYAKLGTRECEFCFK